MSTSDDAGAKHKVYVETRKHFEDARREQVGKYDQAVLWLASSSIAFSLTFLEKFVKGPQVYPKLLLLAWILSLSSIFATVFSHYAGQRSWRKAIKQLDDQLDNPDARWKIDRWSRITEILSVFAGASFAIGAGCLVAFAYFNLPRPNL